MARRLLGQGSTIVGKPKLVCLSGPISVPQGADPLSAALRLDPTSCLAGAGAAGVAEALDLQLRSPRPRACLFATRRWWLQIAVPPAMDTRC